MGRKVEIVHDIDGNCIVVIHDIRFKGKRKINWKEVEVFLKEYVGHCYQITETADKVYIGSDFPDEFTGSKDTARLKGTLAKAKANATQGIEELLRIAWDKQHILNKKEKHIHDAKFGWYKYYSRFALPVYSNGGVIERCNVFYIQMIIRYDKNGKKYLYDMINVKKYHLETKKSIKRKYLFSPCLVHVFSTFFHNFKIQFISHNLPLQIPCNTPPTIV